MSEKLAKTVAHVHLVMPVELHERLLKRAGKETVDRRVRVTPSSLIRWAVEEYLDTWETATFVPAPPAKKVEGT